MRLSAWAIRNPIPVIVMIVALTIAGLAAYRYLVVKQFPNVEFPNVSVTVTQNGAAASEVETQITRPVEDALNGIAGLRHISSTVSLGTSQTTIEFEIGTDMQKATDDVRTAVEGVRVNLPQGIDPPSTQRLDISSAPILTYAVSAPGMSDVALSWFVDDTLARAIQAARGVAQVTRVGGVDREINVFSTPNASPRRGSAPPKSARRSPRSTRTTPAGVPRSAGANRRSGCSDRRRTSRGLLS